MTLTSGASTTQAVVGHHLECSYALDLESVVADNASYQHLAGPWAADPVGLLGA